MKKAIALLLTVIMCFSLCACGKSAAVSAFENQVVALGVVTLDSESAIVAAEDAYTVLSSKDKEAAAESKALLDSKRADLDELVEAQKQAELEAAVNPVIELIDAIGTVTADSDAAITAAENAFAALTAEQQALVGDAADVLIASREAYEAAVAALAEEHANAASSAIAAIGAVTLNSKDLIDAAQNLYNALTAEEKALVTNYGELENAIAQYDNLWAAEKQRIIDTYSAKFEIDSDPFTGITWYMHGDMPNYIDIRSYIIPYIGVQGKNTWMCIRYNYTADDWIFWETLTILVDGNKYYKFVDYFDVTRDNDTEVWEYYDECLNYNQAMDSEEVQMLREIADSNETLIRFAGDEYIYDLTVTSADKQMIRDTLALYEALLG